MFVYFHIFIFFFYLLGGEVPSTKLAALQKVLQSDFLNAVREVYEHVYETVDIQVKKTHTQKIIQKRYLKFNFICCIKIKIGDYFLGISGRKSISNSKSNSCCICSK